MRDILFRGKRKDNGEWVQGDFCGPCNIVFIENGYDPVLGKCDSPMCNDYEIIPETVGQYTGLKDKNGKMIFEGDVVKGVAFSTDFIGVIIWIEEIAGFGVRYFNNKREPTAWENSSILKMIQKGHKDKFAAEIIGNIHDNPELLEAES